MWIQNRQQYHLATHFHQKLFFQNKIAKYRNSEIQKRRNTKPQMWIQNRQQYHLATPFDQKLLFQDMIENKSKVNGLYSISNSENLSCSSATQIISCLNLFMCYDNYLSRTRRKVPDSRSVQSIKPKNRGSIFFTVLSQN